MPRSKNRLALQKRYKTSKKRRILTDSVLFVGGDMRDRTADLLNAILIKVLAAQGFLDF